MSDDQRYWGIFRVDGQWLLAHVAEPAPDAPGVDSDETYVLHEALALQHSADGRPAGITADYMPLPMLMLAGGAPCRFIPSLSVLFQELGPDDGRAMMRRVEQAREHCKQIRAKQSGITLATKIPTK